MRGFFIQLDTVIYQIERVLLVSALIVMALVVFIQVVLRFFEGGFPWAEELARYLMIWAGFLGASIATRQRRHLKIDILPRFLPDKGKAKAAVMRLASVISAGFCFFLVKVGYDFVSNSFKFGRASSSLGIPIWLVQLSIPLTMFIIACRFLGQAFGELQEEVEFDRLVER
jgi:C4-dicarboxylate transporter DctQ subunit